MRPKVLAFIGFLILIMSLLSVQGYASYEENIYVRVSVTNPDNPDSDSDGMPDDYEVANGLDPLDDGSIDPNNGPAGDPDSDNASNIEEFLAGSSPMNGNSLPVNIDIMLHSGFNIFGYPLSSVTSSYDFLAELGDDTEIVKILVYDKASGNYRTTYYDATVPAGDNSAVGYGDGILVYSNVNKTVSFNPVLRPRNSFVECMAVDLKAGLNVITFPCIPAGLTAFQLIQAIGDDTVVSSIQRYDVDYGQFEAAVYYNNQPSGVDFPVAAGEGYLIYMNQDVLGFGP